MKTNKTPEKTQGYGLVGLLALILGSIISLKTIDIRYIAIGMVLFSVLYLGYFVFWLSVMLARTKGLLDKILNCISLTLFVSLMLAVLLWGIALFCWHYDVNYLLDFLNKLRSELKIS